MTLMETRVFSEERGLGGYQGDVKGGLERSRFSLDWSRITKGSKNDSFQKNETNVFPDEYCIQKSLMALSEHMHMCAYIHIHTNTGSRRSNACFSVAGRVIIWV